MKSANKACRSFPYTIINIRVLNCAYTTSSKWKYLFMKQLLLMVLILGTAYVSSAQEHNYDRNRSQWDIRIDRSPSYSSGYSTPYVHRSDEINRIYDKRIRDIENDYTLSPHKQRKMIRQINEERKDRLKALKKWEKKENRKRKSKDYNDRF